MSAKRAIHIALTVLAVALCVALATCGGSHRVAPALQSGGQAIQPVISLDEALAELEGMECPEGVDAALWVELKDALGEALICRVRSRAAPTRDNAKTVDGGAQDPTLQGKFTSTPPTGETNRVDDLTILDNGDGTFTLTWHYQNLGDYDQNGVVAVEDIIPLAEHFGETNEPEDVNCLLAVIDGSGNGRIGIEDITPIAMCFAVEVHHYAVEGAAEEATLYELVSEIARDAGSGEGRLEYSTIIESPAELWHRVVPYDSEGAPGEASNAVLRPSNEPIIYEVSPTEGYQHEERTFSATVTGAEPLTYAWDFGGGATPDTSSETSPTVTLADAGEYSAFLTVTNAYGEASFPFSLIVSERDMWAHTWGGERADSAEALAIDEDGNIYVVGETESFGAGKDDVLVLKYSPAGEVLWAKTWGTPNTNHVAGCALLDSGLLVVGYAYGIGEGADDLFFLKYDLDGNLLWARTWGTPDYDRVWTLAVDTEWNIYVAGVWLVYGGLPDVLVAKFNSDAACVWAKRWDGGPKEGARAAVAAPAGGVHIGGYVADSADGPADAMLMTYSPAGELISLKCWDTGESESLHSLLITPAGHLYVSGLIYDSDTGERTRLLLQLDSELQVVWARSTPCSSNLLFDGKENLYATGFRNLGAVGSYAMLFKYDTSGNVVRGWRTTGSWGSLGATAYNPNGDFFITGSAGSNSGALEVLEEQSYPAGLSSISREGIERGLSGIEGVAEGVETFPEGVIDIGASSVDVLLLKNVN
ncbi:PKD domain-containing protein [bacterium]|nr:PKD domain-containing protein [bacterium]